MSDANARCAVCGAAVLVPKTGLFAGAEVVGAVCPSCADRRVQSGGGCVLVLHKQIDGSRFALGKITVTAGAVAALSESAEHVVTFLSRHVRGDWGAFGDCDRVELSDDEWRRGWEATDDGAKINKWNFLHGRDRLMSEYTTAKARRLWVITDLEGRGATTVLLPEEY